MMSTPRQLVLPGPVKGKNWTITRRDPDRAPRTILRLPRFLASRLAAEARDRGISLNELIIRKLEITS